MVDFYKCILIYLFFLIQISLPFIRLIFLKVLLNIIYLNLNFLLQNLSAFKRILIIITSKLIIFVCIEREKISATSITAILKVAE